MRDRWLAASLAVLLVLCLVGIGWGLPWNLSWSIDDISPWKPLSLPWRYFHGWDKYPYLHWFLSLALYAPYLGWLALTGGLDPACLPSIEPRVGCFADFYGAPTVLMALSRALSVAMALGSVAWVYALARELTGDRLAARLSAAFCAVTAVLVLYAHLGNLDVPAAFWFAASLYCAARLLRRARQRDYVWFGLTAGACIATKDALLAAYALPGAGLLAWHLHRGGRPWDREMLSLAAALLIPYALVQNVPLNFAGFVDHWSFWLGSGEFVEGRRAGSPGLGFVLHKLGKAWVLAAGAPAVALGLAGGAWAAVRRERSALLWVPVLSYLVFAVVLSAFVAERFLIPVALCTSVFAGHLGAWALRRPRLAPLAAAALAAVGLHGLLYSAHTSLLLAGDGRTVAEAWFRAHPLATGATLASCSLAVDLPRLDLQGIHIAWVPPDQDCRARLRAMAPDYVLVSSASPRGLERGLPGWRVVWSGHGGSPLERWLPNPYSWLDPTITVLEPAGRGLTPLRALRERSELGPSRGPQRASWKRMPRAKRVPACTGLTPWRTCTR